jgi:hypothetical protein
MEEAPNELIDDVDQARIDEAHANAATARRMLSEQEPVIGRTTDGIQFEIKDPNRERNKDDVRYWEEEARRDEINAKPPQSIQNRIAKWFRN